ncbi:MAG TPA: rod shape-determining protein MreD [Spirochaetota bacterium]
MALTYIYTGAILVLSLVIQGNSSFDVIKVAGVKPDLLFVSIVYFGYTFGPFYGEVTGFIGGLFHDSISGFILGLLTLPKVLIGFAIGFLSRSFLRQNPLTVFILVFGASIVKGLLTIMLCFAFHEASVSDIISIIIPESFYNAVLAPFIFMLFDKLFDPDIERSGY